MAVKLVSQRTLAGSHLLSATNQGGAVPLGFVAGETNQGNLTLTAYGVDALDPLPKVEITTAGNIGTAEFKAIMTPPSSDIKGREVKATWQGDASAAAANDAVTTGVIAACTNFCECDSDGDGAPDIIVVGTWISGGLITFYSSTDFDGDGTFTSRGTYTHNETLTKLGNIIHKDGTLWCFFCSTPSTRGYYIRSTDGGATWLTAQSFIRNDSGQAIDCDPHGTVLASGRIAVAFCSSTDNYDQTPATDEEMIYVVTWTSDDTCSEERTQNERSRVTPWADDAKVYSSPTIAQDTSGRTVVAAFLGGTGIEMWQSTMADPGAEADEWDNLTETEPTKATTTGAPSLVALPDGKLLIAAEKTGDDIQWSINDGTSNAFSAWADILADGTENYFTPKVSLVGGAVWCSIKETDSGDVLLMQSRYIVALADGEEQWTSRSPHLAATGLWLAWGGSGGVVGDYWTGDYRYDYGADRMVKFTPDHPTRSTADGADWGAIFDLGALTSIAADTICVEANVDQVTVQIGTTNDWDGTPTLPVDADISLVRQTIAEANRTVGAGYVDVSGGTFAPGELIDCGLYFADVDLALRVTGNTTTRIYFDGQDATGYDGDMKILNRKAWASCTNGLGRYVRVSIAAQSTPEGYYEIKSVVLGESVTLSDQCFTQIAEAEPARSVATASGGMVRSSAGRRRNTYALTAIAPTAADAGALVGFFRQQGVKPFALIPDSTDVSEWDLVHVPLGVAWRYDSTDLVLTGV